MRHRPAEVTAPVSTAHARGGVAAGTGGGHSSPRRIDPSSHRYPSSGCTMLVSVRREVVRCLSGERPAWSPAEIAATARVDLDRVLAAVAELVGEGLVVAWDGPAGVLVTLSPAGCERFGEPAPRRPSRNG